MTTNEFLANPERREHDQTPEFVTHVFGWEDIISGDPEAQHYYDQAVELEKQIFFEVFGEQPDQVDQMLGRYNEQSVFFLVTNADQAVGVMRLVWDKTSDFSMDTESVEMVDKGALRYVNPTLDYIRETPTWGKNFSSVFEEIEEHDSDLTFGPNTVDITSWAIVGDYRRRSSSINGNGDTKTNYFDGKDSMAVNTAFFQILFNWCLDNQIDCVTAVYDDNPLLHMFESGFLKTIPGLKSGPLGGSKSSTPVYGRPKEWEDILNRNPLIEQLVFSDLYPVHNIKKPKG